MESKYLTRPEQAEYARSKGFPVSPKTLAKLATTGGGPKFVKFGHRALSTPQWMDDWIKARLSEPVTSTSELRG